MATRFDGPGPSPHRFLLTTKAPRPKPLSTTKGYQPTSTATNIVVFFSIEHNSLPEVTLSALAETGQVESNIPVLKQRSYIGREPVISSALANTRCADLGVDGVLEKLNITLGTSYTLDLHSFFGLAMDTTSQRIPASRIRGQMERIMGAISADMKSSLHIGRWMSLRGVLKSHIAQNYDFGKSYALLRPHWYDFATKKCLLFFLAQRASRERKWYNIRRDVWVTSDRRTISKHTPPLRIWDLYANRVVPSWVTSKRPQGISHAWVDEKDRENVMTPINGNEWPVPLPRDANLDLIRIEMLNIGVEYAWLDVLCLRQEGGKNEYLRVEEWEVDVPAIGSVYYGDRGVVCYFCGLGRPLVFEDGYFESSRCWFNRAWTLQEVPYVFNAGINTFVCGETDDEGINEKAMRTRFDEQLTSLQQMREDMWVLAVLSEMQKRTSAKPLDKVAGVAYVIDVKRLPIYNMAQSEEDAWAELVRVMYHDARADLFFYYPEPGNGTKRWRPSWEQVMTQTLPSRGEATATRDYDIDKSSFSETDLHRGPCIRLGEVCGLADQSHDGNPRRGELVVKDGTGTTHRIKVIANHQYPIPEGLYTLIGNNGDADIFMRYWVVGHQRKRNRFEKLSVIRIADEDERRELQELGVAERRSKVILL